MAPRILILPMVVALTAASAPDAMIPGKWEFGIGPVTLKQDGRDSGTGRAAKDDGGDQLCLKAADIDRGFLLVMLEQEGMRCDVGKWTMKDGRYSLLADCMTEVGNKIHFEESGTYRGDRVDGIATSVQGGGAFVMRTHVAGRRIGEC